MYWRKLYEIIQLLYAISTLRLFINENSTVNAMYGVFVITDLKSWACPGDMATLLIRAY